MADETTITFVPRRLNAAPVVFRGMTGREVILMALGALAAGTPPGLLGAWLSGMFAMAPTIMVAFAFAGVWLGGGIMRRLRRGRPEAWLYRRIEWIAACRGFNAAGLIVTTAVYRIGRARRTGGGGGRA